MSNLVAWGDESVRTQGQDVPAYYMGVCICNLEEVDVHRMLTTVTKRHVPKLHWRDMTPRRNANPYRLSNDSHCRTSWWRPYHSTGR